MPLDLNYYYGNEADQYSFFRIPKTLFTDARYRGVSMEAKVLYGLLLDRMSLSARNGWTDKERRVYIYFTQEEAMALMCCGKDKATKLFRELDQGGIGLIERKKQGQGRPARIYVKNFTLPPEPGQTPPEQMPPAQDPAPSQMPQGAENQQSAPLGSSAVLDAEKTQSAPLETSGLDSAFSAPNKTDKNNTDLNHTESSISPPAPSHTSPPAGTHRRMRMDEMDGYRERIRENIGYDFLLLEHPWDQEEIDGYVDLMAETCASGREYVRVNGVDVPLKLVKERFLKLDGEHIRYVMDSLRSCTVQIINIRAYTLAALYNAPTTMNQHYAAQVGYDMAQGFRSA